mmetsp:Transcript_88681/g.286501  ORF Transcript_88681/g.286501 Transcript_88681/m.286501 type:complete len:93 (+) Transcript_88681:608-886(+)
MSLLDQFGHPPLIVNSKTAQNDRLGVPYSLYIQSLVSSDTSLSSKKLCAAVDISTRSLEKLFKVRTTRKALTILNRRKSRNSDRSEPTPVLK